MFYSNITNYFSMQMYPLLNYNVSFPQHIVGIYLMYFLNHGMNSTYAFPVAAASEKSSYLCLLTNELNMHMLKSCIISLKEVEVICTVI